MILTVKQLQQNKEIIVPQTIAEAVLIKNNGNVITLDKALSHKQDVLITLAGSGLIQYVQNNSVILTHSNNITPTEKLESRLFKYDNNGHIIESVPEGKITIKIENETILESGTEIDQTINLSDDFKKEDNTIKLNWNNI